MKKIISLVVVIIVMTSLLPVHAQSEKTDSFKVYGNCRMCKKRIEKAASIEAVTKADWNVESKIMTVTYDTSKISNETIQKRIALAGHDTQKEIATDQVYEKLPGCCQYDRKMAKSTTQDHH